MKKNKRSRIYLNNEIGRDELEKMLSNHAFWENSAERFASSSKVSWGDRNAMKLEIGNISGYIVHGDLVLDAGCSNGFSTFEIAKDKDIRIRAFDYSEKAIRIARGEQPAKDPHGKITFYCGNILNIGEKDAVFDAAYTIRVLINLPTWERQKEAILEIHRVLKRGGLYLMSEAFSGSLKKLNTLRGMASMKPLGVHEFNLYLEEQKLESFVKRHFDVVAIKRFSSAYYVASRFLRYLTMEKGDEDSYDNEINNLFVKYPETSNSGDFGIQKLYVLKRK